MPTGWSGEAKVDRKFAAILAADIVGYSALMGADEARTVRDLKGHQSVVLPMIGEFGGRIIDTAGDGILAEFASVVKARRMRGRNPEDDGRAQRQIGRSGACSSASASISATSSIDGSDIFGDGVNIAARLEAIAEPGGIFISRQVYDQIEGKLALSFRKLGPQNLKNIAKPVEVFAIDQIGRSHEALALDGQSRHRRSNIAEHLTGCVSPMRFQAAGQFW